LLCRSSCPHCFAFLFLYCYGDHRDLHSFPTRRSSDLAARMISGPIAQSWSSAGRAGRISRSRLLPRVARPRLELLEDLLPRQLRSEEHTSELQSRENLVCRLLLEKKKKKEKHTERRIK